MIAKKLNITREEFEARINSRWFKVTSWVRNSKVGVFYLRTITGFKNIYRWRKVVWNDRDWDYSHIYNVLEFKLDNVSKCLYSSNITYSSNYYASKARLCSKLISKIKDDYYEHEYMDYMGYDFSVYPVDKNKTEDDLDKYINLYPTWHSKAVIYLENNKHLYNEISSKGIVARTIGKLRQNKATEILFKTIECNMKKWWE